MDEISEKGNEYTEYAPTNQPKVPERERFPKGKAEGTFGNGQVALLTKKPLGPVVPKVSGTNQRFSKGKALGTTGSFANGTLANEVVSSVIYGYIWLPTLNDDPLIQEKLFLKQEEYLKTNFTSSSITKFYKDHCSIQTATFSRSELSSLLNTIKYGDIILIESLAQITKTPNEMLSLFTKLKNLGVQLISVKENFQFTCHNFANGPLALVNESNFILKFLQIISDFEKVILNERRLQGIKNAKKAGRYKVNKTKRIISSEFMNFYKLYMDRSNRFTLKNFEEKTGLTRSSIYTLFKQIKNEYGTSSVPKVDLPLVPEVPQN